MYEKIYIESIFAPKKKEIEFYVLQNGKYNAINNKNEVIRSNISKKEIEEKILRL